MKNIAAFGPLQSLPPTRSPDNTAVADRPALAASAVLPAPDRQEAGADVVNLFTHFGAASAAGAYQEIRSQSAASAAASRWPLLAEWLDARAAGTGHDS